MKQQLKFFIVGGSSGIGLELVKIILDNNHLVVVSSRNASNNKTLKELEKNHPKNIILIDLDVCESKFLDSKINDVWNSFNGIDYWFYNAANYEVMDIDNWETNNFVNMNNTIYLGTIRIMTTILPYFKKQKYGKWIWNISLSSYFGLPKGGAYSAPKAALLNLAQSIHPELDEKNIKMQIINHGFVKTRLTEKNNFQMPQLMSAEYTANKIYNEIINSDRFEIKFPFLLSLFLKFLAIIPYSISLKITKKFLK